jgi:hypothetical protein
MASAKYTRCPHPHPISNTLLFFLILIYEVNSHKEQNYLASFLLHEPMVYGSYLAVLRVYVFSLKHKSHKRSPDNYH